MGTGTSTILVVVRERFTPFADSLRSLFSTVPDDVPVIVVDGGAPAHVRDQIADVQQQRSFHWIKPDCYLTPNECRNLAMPMIDTEFVVFADNDIAYEPGWLEALEQHAERNQSDVVAPVICIGPPIKRDIHHAGGRFVWMKKGGTRYLEEQHRLANKVLSDDLDFDQEAPVDTNGVEFHCFLARTSVINSLHCLDDRILSSEHMDLVLRCLASDHRVTFERNAVVTYIARQRFTFAELFYFFFRWNTRGIQESLRILSNNWGFQIKEVQSHTKWLRSHHRRVVASAFPEWIRNGIKHKRLLTLVKPFYFLSFKYMLIKRSRVLGEPTVSPKLEAAAVEKLLKENSWPASE